MLPTKCVYCGEPAGSASALCKVCLVGMEQYTDENQVVIDAYAEHGFDRLVALLRNHEAFHRWLTARGVM